jgi:hypothetical protein
MVGIRQQTSFSTKEEVMNSNTWTKTAKDRREFIGGPDARIIMGNDEAALQHLWRQKRGVVEL